MPCPLPVFRCNSDFWWPVVIHNSPHSPWNDFRLWCQNHLPGKPEYPHAFLPGSFCKLPLCPCDVASAVLFLFQAWEKWGEQRWGTRKEVWENRENISHFFLCFRGTVWLVACVWQLYLRQKVGRPSLYSLWGHSNWGCPWAVSVWSTGHNRQDGRSPVFPLLCPLI